MTQVDYDVVIVGAGFAGAMIASKTAAAGLRTLIIEAGPPVAPRQTWIDNFYSGQWPFPGSLQAPQQNDPDQNWKDPNRNYWVQTGRFGFDSTYDRRAGGTTLHWLGTAMRFVPKDFSLASTYQVKGARDWPFGYDDLEPWYAAAEQEIGVAGDSALLLPIHGKRSQPYPINAVPASYLDQQVAAAVNGRSVTVGGQSIPLQVTATPQARNTTAYDNRPACMGNTSCVPICPIQAKYDATIHLARATSRQLSTPATVWYQTVVTGVSIDAATSQVSGVTFKRWDASVGQVTARRYVLAAHAIETAKILLNSPWKTLPTGERVTAANSSDQVGRNLMDHICQVSWALMPTPVYPYRGPIATSGIETLRDGPLRSQRAAYRIEIGNDGWLWPTLAPQSTVTDLVNQGLFGQALREAVTDNGTRQIRMAFEMESLPLPTSRVTLSTVDDQLGIPRPQIAYDLSDYTLDGFVESFSTASQIFSYLGIDPKDNFTRADENAPGFFEYKGKAMQFRGAGHILGTTIMGDDSRTSVVDKLQRSHDHDNLYLVGSGNFPSTGTANPTLTIAAMALWAAKTITGELR